MFVIAGRYSDTPAELPPLFLGYYEESHYPAPHYQSIVPFSHNAVLKDGVDNGGAKVAEVLAFNFVQFLLFPLFAPLASKQKRHAKRDAAREKEPEEASDKEETIDEEIKADLLMENLWTILYIS